MNRRHFLRCLTALAAATTPVSAAAQGAQQRFTASDTVAALPDLEFGDQDFSITWRVPGCFPPSNASIGDVFHNTSDGWAYIRTKNGWSGFGKT